MKLSNLKERFTIRDYLPCQAPQFKILCIPLVNDASPSQSQSQYFFNTYLFFIKINIYLLLYDITLHSAIVF